MSGGRLHSWSPRRFGQLGLTGVLIFLFALLFLHLLSPGFDGVRQYVSDMANEPLGVLFVGGTFVHGWGNLSLALGLRGTLKPGPLRRWGVAFYSLSALGILTTALFPVDASGQVTTLIGRIHRIAAGSGILLELAALFVFAAAFGQQEPWRRYRRGALVLSIIAAIAVAAFIVGVQMDFAKGVLERLVMAVFLVWGILVSLVLIREPPWTA
ncbi:MAG: DUF998 domain-containing protein [Gammaproteobacteria bacterium]|nr:DUF998 domain-containing protein [Gammaproteobacteria bacterium]